MKQELLHEGDREPEVHHRKPRHLAERIERYLGVAMVVAVALLAGFLFYGLTKGSATPSWMH
jgi:hypothetical protein